MTAGRPRLMPTVRCTITSLRTRRPTRRQRGAWRRMRFLNWTIACSRRCPWRRRAVREIECRRACKRSQLDRLTGLSVGSWFLDDARSFIRCGMGQRDCPLIPPLSHIYEKSPLAGALLVGASECRVLVSWCCWSRCRSRRPWSRCRSRHPCWSHRCRCCRSRRPWTRCRC